MAEITLEELLEKTQLKTQVGFEDIPVRGKLQAALYWNRKRRRNSLAATSGQSLLLEIGDLLLREDGGQILLEDG